jgi:hypothetical protein
MHSDSGKTVEQFGNTNSEDGLVTPEISPTSIKSSLTESDTCLTDGQSAVNMSLTNSKTKSKASKAISGGTSPVTWSVRGVERDTRAVLEKAAERAGKTMGAYLNDEVRAFAQSQITKSEPQVPASPRDMQNQLDHLTQIVEGLAARLPEPQKRGFWQRVFEK